MSERMALMDKYPMLRDYTAPVKKAERKIIGRDKEIEQIQAALMRPEICNVMLLAPAGSGKTALVQGTMLKDTARLYLEVDLAKMIANLSDPNEMAARLKMLFDQTAAFVKDEGKEIVLFIDEFHQVVQLSAAAVEALKPLLADSGTRGIRVIAATTFIEFREYIAPNQPLVERLQRINLPEPDRVMTVAILRGMLERYGMSDKVNDGLLEQIYEYTNRYMPSNAQPRKSILVMDAMLGWHKAVGKKLDMNLLADVIYNAEGVNVAFRVDATTIKRELDKVVLSQDFATRAIANRLQICVADLNDKTKPMSSFLFTGSSGVGKGLRDDTLIPIYTPDSSVCYKRNGDLKVGDYVFNRKGEPVMVTGVYPRGMQDIYKVSLADGRCIYTDSSHLWTYMMSKGKYTQNTYTNSTKELMDRGVVIEGANGNRKLRYWLPMNQPVQYPERQFSVHPYVMGAMIGDGCLTCRMLTFSSSDENLVAHVAELIGGCSYHKSSRRNFSWNFPLLEQDGLKKNLQVTDLFADYPDLMCVAEHKRIPEEYMFGSVEQRWQLVKGLFDTDGCIGSSQGGRYSVSFSSISKGLCDDVVRLLYSLGVASTVTVARSATDEHVAQYCVHVKSSNANKDRFFWLDRKAAIANEAKLFGNKGTKSRNKDYDWVGITNIELMDEQAPTTCIMVDDEEHLYQAGDFIVTHNTAVCKALSKLLFESDRSLIRLDMTEYANSDSLERFRKELTNQVWARPYSLVLLDEIEKACSEVTRLLLQVLDDGRLIDENGRIVSFLNAYIVMTTNAGSTIYKQVAQYGSDDTGSGKYMKKYDKLIREAITKGNGDNKFPPELLGRIDCIVPFQPLSESTMRRIAEVNFKRIVKDVKQKHGMDVRRSGSKANDLVIRYLVEDTMDTDSDSGGARAVMAKLESEVVVPIAEFINAHPNAKGIKVDVVGELVRDNKNIRESDAHIVVTEFVPKK